MYLRKATVDYLGSARYDEMLDVLVRVARLGRTSMTFAFEIWCVAPVPSDKPLVTAEFVYVNANPETMTPAPLPQALRELIAGFEKLAPA